MYEACQTYLKTYGNIDIFDSMVEKYHHVYISWKHWYTMKRHIDAIAVVVAYDFYKECITERLALEAFGFNGTDKINVMDFHTFKVRLSKQGILYTVTNKSYHGDQFMCSVTKFHKRKRRVMNDDGSSSDQQQGRPKKGARLENCVPYSVFKEEEKKLNEE